MKLSKQKPNDFTDWKYLYEAQSKRLRSAQAKIERLNEWRKIDLRNHDQLVEQFNEKLSDRDTKLAEAEKLIKKLADGLEKFAMAAGYYFHDSPLGKKVDAYRAKGERK